MADISQEINDFKNAIYGEEVRGSMISLAEKLNTEVESNTTNVNQAVATANTASTAANQAVQDAETTLQAANQAVTSAEGSAAVAAGSASAAAGHATDAQESATAAAGSASAAAASEQRAEEIAEGLEGFDGQASSIKAEDTQGLLGTAGGQTNVQALIDYIADQVKNKLVSDSALTTKLAEYILKSQIINNLLATQAGNVLDAVQGKALSDMIGDTSQLPEGAENVVGAVAQLNSDISPIKVEYSGKIIHRNTTNIPLSGGMYLLAAFQGGALSLWGLAIASITAYDDGCGVIRVAGGASFMSSSAISMSASSNTLTINNMQDGDFRLSIIRLQI